MFSLRKDQFAVFEQEQLKAFKHRVFQILEKSWSERVSAQGKDTTQQIIQIGIERARRYGLRSELGAFTYINLMFLYGNDFDQSEENPHIRELLADTSIEPDDKIQMLLDEVPEREDSLED